MASMFIAQAGAKLFHKNIPGYAPPDPVYETYTDKGGEEKTRMVRLDSLRLYPRLADRGFATPERDPCRIVQAGHPDPEERPGQGPQA